MRLHRYILLFIYVILTALSANADVVVLNSGLRVEGTIILLNDEVVIIKDASGRRYQYPTNEVATMETKKTDGTLLTETEDVSPNIAQTDGEIGNVGLRLNVFGGATHIPKGQWGEQVGVSLQIGSRIIGDKRIFLGGSIGYNAVLSNGEMLSFIPLKMAVSSALANGKHAPEIGISCGYGFHPGETQGGLCAGANLGWRYQWNNKSAFLLGLQANVQQTQYQLTENILYTSYTNVSGIVWISFGLNATIQF